MDKKSKKQIYILILTVVILGAIIPFAAQFVLPFFFPQAQIAGVELWNQYVSIILGVVATITSIVSLVLGFRSEEQSNDTERRTRDLLNQIQGKIDLLSQKQDQIQSALLREYTVSRKDVSTNLSSGKKDLDDEQIN